ALPSTPRPARRRGPRGRCRQDLVAAPARGQDAGSPTPVSPAPTTAGEPPRLFAYRGSPPVFIRLRITLGSRTGVCGGFDIVDYNLRWGLGAHIGYDAFKEPDPNDPHAHESFNIYTGIWEPIVPDGRLDVTITNTGDAFKLTATRTDQAGKPKG